MEETGVEVLWWSRSALKATELSFCLMQGFAPHLVLCILFLSEGKVHFPVYGRKMQKSGEDNAVFYILQSEDWKNKPNLLLFKWELSIIYCWTLRILCHLTTEVTAERQRLAITLGYSGSASACASWVHNCIFISICGAQINSVTWCRITVFPFHLFFSWGRQEEWKLVTANQYPKSEHDKLQKSV